MKWIIDGILLIIIIILLISKTKQIIIDRTELENYQRELKVLKEQRDDLEKNINSRIKFFEEYQQQITEAREKYNKELELQSNNLDNFFASQKEQRQQEMDKDFNNLRHEKEIILKQDYEKLVLEYTNKANEAREQYEKIVMNAQEKEKNIVADIEYQKQKLEALLEPIKQYEMDRQQRLFYTIQVPDEYKNDINFLLTNVAEKVQHPDIINKLVWAEYVKPYINETFKRVDIRDEPGIYKLTSLIDGKCYIGKSTNIKKRIADHYKSVVGISSIADQAVHHAIAKEGYWNWTIEPVIYCEKDKLNELEKYYINFFKAQEFGYNKKEG